MHEPTAAAATRSCWETAQPKVTASTKRPTPTSTVSASPASGHKLLAEEGDPGAQLVDVEVQETARVRAVARALREVVACRRGASRTTGMPSPLPSAALP
ncbi:unnamed protein product [Prorocentrum cordatum]|uniref:Uncharacterized protein n=1 Tax=Prorocentrum cordatum TaxID=2364126 RepID=A0ABN9T124_9DINO|nr:unnamed protein product [Polarella glacialis]